MFTVYVLQLLLLLRQTTLINSITQGNLLATLVVLLSDINQEQVSILEIESLKELIKI